MINTSNKKGIILYTTCLLNKINNRGIKYKNTPKEVFVLWRNIIYATTTKIDNWIKVSTVDGKEYYEESSLINFMRLAKKSNFIFSKVTGGMTINIAKIIAKNDLNDITLVNNEIYKIKKHFKNSFKECILKLWDE